MSKQNVMLDNLLDILKRKEDNTKQFLNNIALEKERRKYRDDILQLSSADVSLLTSYYMNSNYKAQQQFESLLDNTYDDQNAIELFMTEFKNLYFLNKSELTKVTQYGAAKRVVLDFINRLKDEALTEKKIDRIKEKQFIDKLFIIRKLIRYFSAKAGTVEIKNIDDFIMMLNVLDFNDKEKNEALIIAIENNTKFYTKNISVMKKKNIDFLDLE